MSFRSRVSVFHLVLYRLWRGKRLLLLVPLMITLAALAAGQIGDISSYYFEVEEVALAGGIALLAAALSVILLPAAPLEVLFGALAAAILVMTEPWQGVIFQPAEKGGDFTPLWLRASLFLAAWMVLMSVGFAVAMAIAGWLKGRARPLRYRHFLRGGDAATLRALFQLRPDSTSGPVTYGSREWDGWVKATLHVRGPDPVNYGMSDIRQSFAVRQVGTQSDTDVYEVRNDDHLHEVRMSYRDSARGAWIVVEERPGPMAPLMGLSLRLNEGGTDLLRARVDYHLDRPSPATVLRPMRSLLCTLAWLTHVPGPKPRQPAE